MKRTADHQATHGYTKNLSVFFFDPSSVKAKVVDPIETMTPLVKRLSEQRLNVNRRNGSSTDTLSGRSALAPEATSITDMTVNNGRIARITNRAIHPSNSRSSLQQLNYTSSQAEQPHFLHDSTLDMPAVVRGSHVRVFMLSSC